MWPALFLFAVPVFSTWFTGCATRSYDERIGAAVLAEIAADTDLVGSERAEVERFYRQLRVSDLCVSEDPQLAPLRAQFDEPCDDFWQFRTVRVASWATTGLGLFAVAVALLGALLASRSREAQYRSFVATFQVLRPTTAAIVVAQAALLVWLSFWVTAIVANAYFVQLILVSFALAALTAYQVLRGLFAKPSDILSVDGLYVPRGRAPRLVERIESIAATLGTPPPEHIIAGIDDNFFVCAGKVSCTDRSIEGRTLFVSLSLLRILDADEAEAVLAHEMAHFSGRDVEHSTRLAPAIRRFGAYLRTIRESPIAYPVASFLAAVFGLFELSFSRTRRVRELAADAEAAQVTTPDSMARALVKIGAYASFGDRVLASLFERDATHESLGIAERIAAGFSDYTRTPELTSDLVASRVPHPFDSHPPLLERIAAVGSAIGLEDFVRVLSRETTSGYYAAIEGAAALERRQWDTFEARFAANHQMALAHRYRPDTAEERALVEAKFPARTFPTSGDDAIRLDCLTLHCVDFTEPVPLARIERARIDNHLLREHLFLELAGDGMLTSARRLPLHRVVGRQHFLDAFNAYWTRARAADAYQTSKGRGRDLGPSPRAPTIQ